MKEVFSTESRYEQIIELPHHVSENHKHMDMSDRAAQFSPFAALTGYDDCVTEAARMTDTCDPLDDDRRDELDRKVSFLAGLTGKDTVIKVRYFVKDRYKDGGEYMEKTGCLKYIDEFGKALIFTDDTSVSISDISDINGDIFENISLQNRNNVI